jgi:PAS domain S-box-containing protein
MKRGSLLTYLLSQAMVAVIIGGRLALAGPLDDPPYLPFIAVALLASYWGGLGPGLAAIATSALAAAGLIALAPPGPATVPDSAALACFIAVAGLGTGLINRYQRAMARSDGELAGLNAAREAKRHTQESLRDNERMFRTMLDTLPQIAFIIGADGTADYYNQPFVDYVGQAIGPKAADRTALLHPDDRPRLVAARNAAVAGGADYMIDARLRRHDGLYRWHSIRNKPIRNDGRPVAWLGIAEDIDEIRRLNETLEARIAERTRERDTARDHLHHTQRLEALGQLTGGVAHDFNNLLTAIVGNLDLLDRHVSSGGGKRLIEAAHRAAARGARLVQSLLAFARRQTLRPSSVNPNDLIAELGELLRRAAGDTIAVELLLDATTEHCLIDAAQFQAALLNLVVNARDAMPAAGGQIKLATSDITVADGDPRLEFDAAPGHYVRIELSDTGTGMIPSVLARAFEPFFTTKDVGKGSGLGLSQVYGFVKQSGGFINLDSEPGRGTSVSIHLPCLTPDLTVETPAEPAVAAPPAGVETILVAEDDPDVRAAVADSLRSLGYRVLTCDDGITALALLQRPERIDLLFADVSMPNGLLGDELGRRALRIRPDMRVLLTSGFAATGPDGGTFHDFRILRKPYRREELAASIREILDN